MTIIPAIWEAEAKGGQNLNPDWAIKRELVSQTNKKLKITSVVDQCKGHGFSLLVPPSYTLTSKWEKNPDSLVSEVKFKHKSHKNPSSVASIVSMLNTYIISAYEEWKNNEIIFICWRNQTYIKML